MMTKTRRTEMKPPLTDDVNAETEGKTGIRDGIHRHQLDLQNYYTTAGSSSVRRQNRQQLGCRAALRRTADQPKPLKAIGTKRSRD